MRHFALILAAVIIASGIVFAGTDPCEGGATPYFACSVKSPGYRCGPSGLTLDVASCCTKIPGYIITGTGDDAACVQAKCDDGTASGSCATTKPKVCIGGSTYADNATKCGCPTGKKMGASGIFCEGIPCTDGAFTVDDGTCSPKKVKKCIAGVLTDKASECGCPSGQTRNGETCGIVCSDGTKDGDCASTKPKQCVNGYLLDNAVKCGCPDGKNANGKYCTDSILGGLGTNDIVTGGDSNSTGGAGGSSPISCCCLPTALIGIIGGFAVFRKK